MGGCSNCRWYNYQTGAPTCSETKSSPCSSQDSDWCHPVFSVRIEIADVSMRPNRWATTGSNRASLFGDQYVYGSGSSSEQSIPRFSLKISKSQPNTWATSGANRDTQFGVCSNPTTCNPQFSVKVLKST